MYAVRRDHCIDVTTLVVLAVYLFVVLLQYCGFLHGMIPGLPPDMMCKEIDRDP